MSLKVGLVVHPTRDVQEALGDLQTWVQEEGANLLQVDVPGQQQVLAPIGAAEECDVVVAIGGDGTALAAIRAAAPYGRPVMGVSCGSLGVLTAVPTDGVSKALDQFCEGRWRRWDLPALEVTREHHETVLAFNDIAIVRRSEGQIRTWATVDGSLYARLAGDGCIVSTPVGSSAYAFAAGGPLLAPGTESFVFTPLSSHGGSCPPLVLGPGSELEIEIAVRFGGARLELDGKVHGEHVGPLSIGLRPGAATIVAFEQQETFIQGLRRRGVIADSPRLVAEDDRRNEQQEREGDG